MFIGEHAPSVQLLDIPRGLQGVRVTVGHMKSLIHQGSQSLMVRRAAEEALRFVPANDYKGELQGVHDWVKKHTRFTRDPHRTERLKSPDQILTDIETKGLAYLDCDDYSLLLGSMLKSVGFPVRVNVVGKRNFPHHVFVSARAKGRWFALDPQVSQHPRWRFRENTNV